jgi:predicted phage baseplate assembly protein
VEVFKPVPVANDAIYFGFENNLRALTLLLTIDSNIEGIGVDPHDPPLVWECWDGIKEVWVPMRLNFDTTGGLNTYGNVMLEVPASSTLKEINGQRAFWIRCRATHPRSDQRPYTSSPRIQSFTAESIGGTAPARHCLRISNEILGRSNGNAGQKYFLQHTPVLIRESDEFIQIETEKEGQYESWQEVKDFSDSQPDDRHFTLDSVTGEVQFGPLIRQPSGQERQFARIPSLNRQIRFSNYRWGGGVIGNVGKGTISVLKSSIPYVASVTNFAAAVGGTDAESLEAAMMRAPRVLRNQTRAVTADDFESLALEASVSVARAKCLAAGNSSEGQAVPPGVVRLLLVPKVEDLDGPIPNEQLDLLSSVKSAVQEYLDERRLLAMRVEVAAPEYYPISVVTQVRARPIYDFDQIISSVKRNLYRYINPVQGGPKGQGWPFGRGLFPSEVYSTIQSTQNVEYIENVKIYLVDKGTGQKQLIDTRLNIPPNGLLCSSEHKVEVIPAEGYE